MPQDLSGDFYTRTGQRIKFDDLTLQFTFFGKTVPLGKFDPETYPKMQDKKIQQLGSEFMAQLEDSGYFTTDELVTIAMMNSMDFLQCINNLQPDWNKYL